MPRPPEEFVLFHGEVYNKKEMEKYAFPVGCKFNYKNVSYNDIFTVTSIRKDPGAEYRQIIGNVAGEVWMLLSSLQREVAAGAITYLNDNKDKKIVKSDKKVNKDKKASKPTKQIKPVKKKAKSKKK